MSSGEPAFRYFCPGYNCRLLTLEAAPCHQRRQITGPLSAFGGKPVYVGNEKCAGCNGVIALDASGPWAEAKMPEAAPPAPAKKKRARKPKAFFCVYCYAEDPQKFDETNKSVCCACRVRIRSMVEKEYRKTGTRPKTKDLLALRQIWPGMWREGAKRGRFFPNGATTRGGK